MGCARGSSRSHRSSPQVGDSRVGQQLTLSLLDELLWFEKLTGCVAMSHMKGDTITVRLDDDLLPILDEVHALPLDALNEHARRRSHAAGGLLLRINVHKWH